MCTSCSYIFFFSLYGDHRDLHSFPTRRSSDLVTFNTIEDSVIHGAVVIDGYNGFWMGFIRNNVHGLVTLSNNVLVDEDGNEYVTNTIHGGLRCFGNDPAPQVGDSEGERDVVTGKK